MRRPLTLVLFSFVLCIACVANAAPARIDRVLFVGNSLTYFGNLPAVFAALARANGHAVHSYMVVSPGGTLSERVADGSAVGALRKCHCNVLILQERGGDLFGSFGNTAERDSRRAITKLATIGDAARATVILLGTYNGRQVTPRLVAMESAAARAASIPYVAVSGRFWCLRDLYPSLQWLRRPSGHPGADLTLLDSVLLYRQLFGALPAATGFEVHAPIYGDHSGLEPTLRDASAPPPNADTPMSVSYSAAVVGQLVKALEKPCS